MLSQNPSLGIILLFKLIDEAAKVNDYFEGLTVPGFTYFYGIL
jgi:hypothetical protein